MKTPDRPENEVARLKALHSLKILDTPAEERFDRLTRIANKLFGVPIALVSLVDSDRQWFKSSYGLDACETPRDISFCGHAILGDDIFIVNDTKTDQRFADNPLVTNGPYIRFYAGCPLKMLDGSKLGTMCIIDQQPRVLDEQEQTLLKDLASMVEREIELTHMALVDDLTQISNRRGFMMQAQKNLQLAKRQGFPITLVYFDLNKFKQINDTYGHAEGDKALTNFASNIKSITRDTDLLARLGGDEFALLFTDTTKDSVKFVIERFRQLLLKLDAANNAAYPLAFSCGIVEYKPNIHANIDDLLSDGDILMYQQKQQQNEAVV